VNVSLLYRGPLASCNYDCSYCPFAKRVDPPEALRADEAALRRFVDWVSRREQDRISILFTPWGEALVRRWYREALIELGRLPHVEKVAVQTNLSCSLDWLDACDRSKVALWCTFHPSQTTRERFVNRCRKLDRLGIRYSVGCVGIREDAEAIQALRREVSPDVYVWVNAIKRPSDYYDEAARETLRQVDPHFMWNERAHDSLGRPCRTGVDVYSIDGDGTVARCHFVKTPIGNLYAEGFDWPQVDPRCPNGSCGCHIGYVHLEPLRLYDLFEGGVLERIPRSFATANREQAASTAAT
jgi:MoaA/NifB/PqqE/SkfB family radical SAM enzyme